ncbi:MAG: FAD-dependent oxidoreductase [Pseudomonadota bacterium]
MTTRPIIIGAGMAGLACARVLKDNGWDPLILDKGRGIGGRLASRRTPQGWHFDHGAQYVRATSQGFAEAIRAMTVSGHAAPWAIGKSPTAIVGVPGMSALAKSLSQDIDIRSNLRVTSMRYDGQWTLETDAGAFDTQTLIVTTPAPQTLELLGPDHALVSAVARAQMVPNLTLMLGFSETSPKPGFMTRRDASDPIAWLAHNSTKSGRPPHDAWVAQASLAFSKEHLEQDKDSIAATMLPLACDRLGIDPSHATYVSAHRWRYATVAKPVGAPFLKDGNLYLGGDWCLGAKVEHAWTSGTAIAQAILDSQ